MLFDPKWEAQTKPDVFSLAGFIAWLENQPAEKRYNWYDIHACVVCQYLDAQGVEKIGGPVDGAHELDSVFKDIEQYWRVAGAAPFSFGAVLKRAKDEAA